MMRALFAAVSGLRNHQTRMDVIGFRLASTRLADGTEIAYATAGRGPLLVHAGGWLTHLEASWALPAERGFYEQLARGRTLVFELIHQGRLKSIRIGARRLITRNQLEQFLGGCEEGT